MLWRVVKGNLQDVLESIDNRLMEDEGSAYLREQRVSLLKEMSDLDHLDQLDLVQKAKIQSGIEGDENSKFFHGMLNRKRRQIGISGLLIDGVWVDNPAKVKEVFHNYFQSLFKKNSSRRPVTDGALFSTLSQTQVDYL